MASPFDSSSSQGPRLVNVTVDDQLGDPTTGLTPEYLPNDGTWHVGSPTEDCPQCHINPSILDLTQVHDQTWHDGTYHPPNIPAAITFGFTGSAVYVFNILPNTLANHTTTYVNISFSVDGDDTTVFTHIPDPSDTILYNQLVYHNTALCHGPHTLVIVAACTPSLVLFDYLLYTTQSNDTVTSFSTPTNPPMPTTMPSGSPRSTSSSTPSGAIIGVVAGAIAVLFGAGIWALQLRRRRSGSEPMSMQGGPQNNPRCHTGGSSEGGSPAFTDPIIPVLLSKPAVRSFDGGASTTSLHYPASNVPRPSSGPSLALADDGSSSIAAGTNQLVHVEPIQKLEISRQRTTSVPSSEAPAGSPHSKICSGGAGMKTVVGRLEAEVATLRGGLAALRTQLAGEPLPTYAE